MGNLTRSFSTLLAVVGIVLPSSGLACQDYSNSPVASDSIAISASESWGGTVFADATQVLVVMRDTMAIFNRSSLNTLSLIGTYPLPSYTRASAYNSPYLVVGTDISPRLAIYNCSSGGVSEVANFPLATSVRSLALQWPNLYLADSEGIKVWDVSSPESPSLVGVADHIPEPYPGAIAVQGNYLYAATPNLHVYSLGDPTAPTLVAEIDSIITAVPPTTGFVVSENTAYVSGSAGASGLEYWALGIVDISDPVNPFLLSAPVGSWGNSTRAVRAVDGQYLYTSLASSYDWGGFAGVEVLEISDPASPVAVGQILVQRDDTWMLGIIDSTVVFTGSDPSSSSTTVYSAELQCGASSTFTIAPDGTGSFPTIQDAIDAADPGDIIRLLDGTFSGPGNRDLNFFGKSISLVSVSGSPFSCVIDCGGTASEPHRGIVFESSETMGASLEGVTIQGGWFETGGAIRISNGSSPRIRDCRILDCTATSGGAIAITDGSLARIEGSLIAGNQAELGSALYLESSSVEVIQCTLSENNSSVACIFGIGAAMQLINTSVAFNGPGSAVASFESTASLSCCDVYGNQGGDFTYDFDGALGQDGNISVDPLFCGSSESEFSLVPWSICLPESELNPCGELIGAYSVGEDCELVAASDSHTQVGSVCKLTVSSNPFYPNTTVSFITPGRSHVTLDILDVSGRRIRRLAMGSLAVGAHSYIWDGRNDRGQVLASGLYLCRLTVGSAVSTRKLVLLH